jgi:heat shock protein HslJ
MKKNILLLMLVLSMLLAACSGGKNAATVAPTVTAKEVSNTAMPTLAPSPTTEQLAPAPPPEEDLAMLRENPWQWVSFTNPMEQYTLENSQNYQLTFNEGGTVNIVADCNNAIGTYTIDSSSIKIEVGPMTMAACPPESRSDDFVKYLGFARIYFFKDGNLFMDLFADGGTLEFTPAE